MSIKDRIVALHLRQRNLTSYDIGRELGCNARWVRRVLQGCGLRLRTGPRRLQEWETQAIIDAYADGEKREAIAAEFGLEVCSVRRLARRAGLPGRAE